MGYREPRTTPRDAFRKEQDAREAVIAARYGVPVEQVPLGLLYDPGPHPKLKCGRRMTTHVRRRRWWVGYHLTNGWRGLRETWERRKEELRQVEIEFRRSLSKRKGRGKPLDRNVRLDALRRREKSEWREELA